MSTSLHSEFRISQSSETWSLKKKKSRKKIGPKTGQEQIQLSGEVMVSRSVVDTEGKTSSNSLLRNMSLSFLSLATQRDRYAILTQTYKIFTIQ